MQDFGPILQKAIDEARGGIVTIPSGTYTLHSQVIIKKGVTVAGEGWKFDPSTFNTYGTVLYVKHGKGSVDDKNNAAILMESGTRLEGVCFVYEDQVETLAVPIEYGPTIKFYEDTNGIGESSPSPYHTCEVRDVFFYKSYCSIDARGSSARAKGYAQIATCRYENILMCALKYGIRIDTMNDWNILNKIEQQPGHIGHYLEIGNSLRDWVQRNCTVFDFSGLIDWIKLTDCCAWACNRGINCERVSGPITLIGCDFDACRDSICISGNSSVGAIKAVGCTFTAFDTVQQYKQGPDRYSGHVLVLESGASLGHATFVGCHLFGPSGGWLRGKLSNYSRVGCTGMDTDVSESKPQRSLWSRLFG